MSKNKTNIQLIMFTEDDFSVTLKDRESGFNTVQFNFGESTVTFSIYKKAINNFIETLKDTVSGLEAICYINNEEENEWI